jgi:CDP-glucose 4,6-dehydratase
MNMKINAQFWQGKRVFITGHTGFKGSWLSLWLQRFGAEVTGYALEPPTNPSLFDVARVADGMCSIIGDIRDAERLSQALTESRPDVVIHMAAQPIVRYSYEAPVETYSTNVMGTVNVLEAVRKSSYTRVAVMVTSDKCYENREWVWGYREVDRMGGDDPYSGSKGCAELVVHTYRRSFFPEERYDQHGLALASVRAGNVIGGGDWARDRLVPDTMTAIGNGRPVVIRNPSATRPWQHVLVPLSGYLGLAEKLWDDGKQYVGGWNFGPSDEDAKPVEWIIDYLTKAWGEGAKWQLDAGTHPHENTFLKLDTSKARSYLGFEPRLDIGMALDWVTDWYRAYLQQQDMRLVTEAQIGEYERLLAQ